MHLILTRLCSQIHPPPAACMDWMDLTRSCLHIDPSPHSLHGRHHTPCTCFCSEMSCCGYGGRCLILAFAPHCDAVMLAYLQSTTLLAPALLAVMVAYASSEAPWMAHQIVFAYRSPNTLLACALETHLSPFIIPEIAPLRSANQIQATRPEAEQLVRRPSITALRIGPYSPNYLGAIIVFF
jgi:hypothetical protein